MNKKKHQINKLNKELEELRREVEDLENPPKRQILKKYSWWQIVIALLVILRLFSVAARNIENTDVISTISNTSVEQSTEATTRITISSDLSSDFSESEEIIDDSTTTTKPKVTTTTKPKVTTTTKPKVTTTTIPTYLIGGSSYTCDKNFNGWKCTSGSQIRYCDGYSAPDTCSSDWYPDVLDDYEFVEFSYSTYLCTNTYQTYSECYEYFGGNPSNVATFGTPDIWCDYSYCYEYDPNEWLVNSYGLFCQETYFGYQQYDCYTGSGGNPPSYASIYPDYYCSGYEASDCSTDWYPDELDDYVFITHYGSSYLCKNAWGGNYGDLDCGRYTGGNPSSVYTGSLKCSPSGYSGYECSEDYYPSAWDGYELATIGYGQYVCEDTWQGQECYRYYGGDPASSTWGMPDYYCNYYGCSEDDYP